MKNKKKVILYIFYISITIAFLIFILSMNDIGDIFQILQHADIKYILISLLLVLIYLGMYPLTLCILSKAKKVNVSNKYIYSIGMSEHFFNGITPFATGGQPFQIYALSKKKVDLSTSTGLLMMNFIIHMCASNLFALISLFFFNRFATSTSMKILAIVGFSMNFLVLVLMVSLATSKTLKHFILWVLSKLAKIKFLHKLITEKMIDIENYIENTQNSFKELWHNKKSFITCFIIRFLTLSIYYAVPFYILKSLHMEISYANLFISMCASSFAITMCVFLPTPGSSGGIEYAFSNIFASLVVSMTSSTSYCGMLIWRLLTYYLPVLISFLFYLYFEISKKEVKI